MAAAKVSRLMGWAQPSRRCAGEVEEGGEAAGGAGELGRPAREVGQVAAVGREPRLQVALELKQQLPRGWVEGEDGGVVAGWAGQAGGQGLELEGVAVGHGLGDGWGAGLAAADQARREAVEEPGQQPTTPESGPAGQPVQHLGLDSQPDGQTWPLDVLGWAAAAVDLEQIPGMALEVDARGWGRRFWL